MSKSKKQTTPAEEAAAAAAAGTDGNTPDAETDDAAATTDQPAEAAEVVEGDDAPVAEPDPLEVLAAERDEFREKWLRAVAELDNVRKRAGRDLAQGRKFAQADVLRSILEVVDNFERALQTVPVESDTDAPDAFREGIELIHQRLRGVLKDKGVTPIEALEAHFDPNVHEAVGQFEREGVETGIVIEVVQQGYHFEDMVLRPARVIISA